MVVQPITTNTQDTWAIDGIVVKDRKRALGDIAALIQSIQDLGLLNPITITTDGILVAGYHRLEACKSLGWRFIPVHVVDLDRLNAELAEIDENLMRNELHWFDRDKQLARRKEIYETKEGVIKNGGDRKSDSHCENLIPSFVKDASTKTKQAPATIYRSIERADAFSDEQGEVLKQASVKPTEATRLARLEPAQRTATLERLAASVASGEKKTATVALLEVKRAGIEAQAQASPTKPLLTRASWQAWLPAQPKCDLLITDPPYMYTSGIDDIDGFAREWLPVALAKVKDTGRAYVCVGAYPQELRAYLNAPVPSDLRLLNVLVWTYKNRIGPRPHNAYKSNWQAILYYIGLNSPHIEVPDLNEQFAVQEINAPDGRIGDLYHPWQKPDDLAERLIRHSSRPGDVVLDCFAGTGTFLLAAHRLGRVARGCDVSEEMLGIAEQRGCEVLR